VIVFIWDETVKVTYIDATYFNQQQQQWEQQQPNCVGVRIIS